MRLFERATRINEEVLQPADPERARASWFIPDLFPLSGYDPDDMDLFERESKLARKTAVSPIRARQKASATWQRCCPARRTTDERGRYLNEPSVPGEIPRPGSSGGGAAAANLADVLSRTGDNDRPGRHYERALGVWEQSLGVITRRWRPAW